MKKLKYPDKESRRLAICELNESKEEIENSKKFFVEKQNQLHDENPITIIY